MSKMQWFGCLVVAAAVGAPASRAEEPPPFPAPAPAPGTERPASDTPTVDAPAADTRAQPQPAPGPATTQTADVRVEPATSDLAWVRWNGNALRFEQTRFQGEARLFVQSGNGSGWQVHRGADLETILRANPLLAGHPEVAALREHVAGPAAVRVVVQGYTIGYEQDPVSGEVRLFQRGQRGETMWSGPDLATIAAQNPEVTRVQEWPAFEARVRAASTAAQPIRLRPGVGGVAVVTFAPQDVSVTVHQWRDRGWQPRSYRGSSLSQLARTNSELLRVVDLGDGSMAPTPPAPAVTPLAPAPPRRAEPTPPPRPYSPPAGGGGSGAACGAGGKNCGGR
jgi:hypothetical protein